MGRYKYHNIVHRVDMWGIRPAELLYNGIINSLDQVWFQHIDKTRRLYKYWIPVLTDKTGLSNRRNKSHLQLSNFQISSQGPLYKCPTGEELNPTCSLVIACNVRHYTETAFPFLPNSTVSIVAGCPCWQYISWHSPLPSPLCRRQRTSHSSCWMWCLQK